MLQRMYDDGQQRNGMSLGIRHKYSLSNKKKSSQKKNKERAFTFQKDFYQSVYTENTL